MSPGAVHKIEKSGMTPTIASLMKIAAALGKSVAYFVDEPATPDVSVVRADERAQRLHLQAGPRPAQPLRPLRRRS